MAQQALPFQVYGLELEHKHTPEIQMHAGLAARPMFIPAYGAYRQGIVLTVPIDLRWFSPGLNGGVLRDALARHYDGAHYVQVMDMEATQALTCLDPQALNGSNNLRLGVLSNDKQGQVLLFAIFDNLGKGASGAAVQNLDLMLGN